MVVDFEHLNKAQIKVFSELRKSCVADYNKISSELLMLAPDNLSWLTSNLTSRNVNFSKTLYYLICLALLDYYKCNGEQIEKVYTSDIVLYKTVKRQFNTFLRCSSFLSRLKRSLSYHKTCYFMLYDYIRWCAGAIRARSKLRKQQVIESHEITIIDTYIPKVSERYVDRYYGNILKFLSERSKDKIYFLPQYLPVPKRKDVERIVEKSEEKIFYIFDFLKIKDFIASFWINYKANKINIPKLQYKCFDLTHVLNACKRNQLLSHYFAYPILWDRFFFRLKESGVELKVFVDWFENQAGDKACYYCIPRYYPNAEINAYLGFIANFIDSPHNLSTNVELSASIAPRKLFLCNKLMRDEYINSGYKGVVDVAPTFRANKIWDVKRTYDEDRPLTIVVPLGLIPYEVEYKTRFIRDYLCGRGNNTVKILLKPHPAYSIEHIRSLLGNDSGVEIGTGDIYDYLTKADGIIGSNSTTLYEALAMGLPVISLKDSTGSISVSKPTIVGNEMWYDVYDADSFDKALNSVRSTNKEILKSESEKLKDYFFETIDDSTIIKLLGF